MLTEDNLQWLLDAQTPTIRYLTLQRLLKRPAEDPEVQALLENIGNSGPVPSILHEQTESGNWAGERSYYTPKYTSTHWSMLLLAELCADKSDRRLIRGAAFMLKDTCEEAHEHIEQGRHGLECFWGNLLRYELHCGMVDDARLSKVVEILAINGPDADWRCKYNDERPCAWGAARALWGLAALPENRRDPNVQGAIQNGIKFLLEDHDLLDNDYPTPEDGKVHPLWSRLNFPLFYQADILFVLRVLGDLGALKHPGAEPALAWLESKRGENGRWRGASPFRSRTWKALGGLEERDRWISLQALLILDG